MIFFKTKRQKEKELIKDYIERMHQHPYVDAKQHLISILDWIFAYYEDRTAATPKEYLEALINSRPTESYSVEEHFQQIRLLYNWVYHKQIVGF